ncbi:hypothetical protein Tsubulata_005056 [Turnera subulata]|uniref:RING-type E3 ubiquitin transferase n=1 Tax=Turnera subulata TaxID=218843 RepID=A0A9Q0FAZ7_9ROSI|nr:hypothetical protein Tsubulata_005056 [Turnera subulata]
MEPGLVSPMMLRSGRVVGGRAPPQGSSPPPMTLRSGRVLRARAAPDHLHVGLSSATTSSSSGRQRFSSSTPVTMILRSGRVLTYHERIQLGSAPQRHNGTCKKRTRAGSVVRLGRVVVYNTTASDDLDPNNWSECVICLEDFKDGDACKVLDPICEHMYHETCINEWLVVGRDCPLCRGSVDKDSG